MEKKIISQLNFFKVILITNLFINIYCDNINEENYINYTKEEILEFKKNFKEKIKSDPRNLNDRNYQMQRALKTIDGEDTDYIPKIKNAGKIFTQEGISYQLMHQGSKIILNSYYNTQWLTDVISGLQGHHEPQEEKCFYEILKYMPEDATMIELGAYWAYYSLWFASKVKNPTNYVIEPDPHRLETGRRNFLLNNKNGIFIRGYAGIVYDNEPNVNGAQNILIDDLIEKEKINRINILHSDIQGGETAMLESIVKHLDKIDYFFISTHNPHHPKCLNFFRKHDFIILAEHSCEESCSGDGLIVAKRKGCPGPDHIEIKKY